MYSKLFSNIADSTLMRESVNVRYVFMMLLAIADPDGVVDGTAFTLSRKLCISEEEFDAAMERLTAPDQGSNMPDNEGRRLVPSDRGRGWLITTYKHYAAIRNEEHRRQYMREYMRNYRAKEAVNINGKERKQPLTALAQGEGDAPREGAGSAPGAGDVEREAPANGISTKPATLTNAVELQLDEYGWPTPK